jgi:hypothetical protein
LTLPQKWALMIRRIEKLNLAERIQLLGQFINSPSL